MPFKPRYPDEFPTMGEIVMQWAAEYLAPTLPGADMLTLPREAMEFVYRFYELRADGSRRHQRSTLVRARGWMKPIAIDTPVYTYNRGHVSLGEVEIGDFLIGSYGPTRVVATSAVQMRRKCWRLTTERGASIVAASDHLWTVKGEDALSDTIMTSELEPGMELPSFDHGRPTMAGVGLSIHHGDGISSARSSRPWRVDAAMRAGAAGCMAWAAGYVSEVGRSFKVPREAAPKILALLSVAGLNPSSRSGSLGRTVIDVPEVPEQAGNDSIASVRPCESVPVKCVTVDAIDGLFAAGSHPVLTHNSPLSAIISTAELFGPVRFVGWDSAGRPVGEPHANKGPFQIRLAAVTLDQTQNCYDVIRTLLSPEARICHEHDVFVDDNEVYALGYPGRLIRISANAKSAKGRDRVMFTAFDQTELITTPSEHTFADVLLDDATKTSGIVLETPNAYAPGTGSHAEKTHLAYKENVKLPDILQSMHYDSRGASLRHDLSDPDQLLMALRESYGDASGHPEGCVIHRPPCPPGPKDLMPQMRRFYMADTNKADFKRNFLTQHEADDYFWIPPGFANTRIDTTRSLTEWPILVGFDGSVGNEHDGVERKPDATALIGISLYNPHVFTLGIWEARDGQRGWRPPFEEIDAKMREVLATYDVYGAFCDNFGWLEYITRWERDFGNGLRVRAGKNNPMGVWMGGSIQTAYTDAEEFRKSFLAGSITWDGNDDLARHFANTRVKVRSSGEEYKVVKASNDSPDKIDGVQAMLMAWRCRRFALQNHYVQTEQRMLDERAKNQS